MKKITMPGKSSKGLKIQNISHANSSMKEIYKGGKDDLDNIAKILIGEAAISPKYHDYLSKALGRDLKQEKSDTRDYNIKFISKLDIQTIEMMDAGIKFDCVPGDTLNAHAERSHEAGDSWLLNLLKATMEKKDYMSFPFCSEISSDIRARYLLRTDENDTYESIFKTIEEKAKDFISSEDWTVLKSAMADGIKRISREQVLFLEPLEDGVMGKIKKLSKKEKETFNLPFETVDVRLDSHDLVALKELSLCMQGNRVTHLSIFAGAFAKYIPELNKKGYRGVTFKVEKNQLISIKLAPLTGKKVPFGPIEAALALHQTFGSELPADGSLAIGTKYYATVSGFVAGPKDKDKSWSYENKAPLVDEVIPAAETFIFHSDGLKGIMATRLYFYAYSPASLNIMHQNMSVVFGDSDQMFHSCAYDPNNEFYNDEIKAEFKEKIFNYGYDNEPGVKAAHYLLLTEASPPEVICSFSKYQKIGKLASDSMFGENKYTVEKYFKFSSKFDKVTAELLAQIQAKKTLINSYPLTSRFVVFNYFEGKNGGLTKDAQLTTYRRLKRYNFNELVQDWAMTMQLNRKMIKFNQLLDSNVAFGEAYGQCFDKEDEHYMDTGKVKPKPSDKK